MQRHSKESRWEVVSEADIEKKRERARANAQRLRGIYFVVAGCALVVFAMGLAQAINYFSEEFAKRNGDSHFSQLLSSGAVLCGAIAVCKGIFKIITGQ